MNDTIAKQIARSLNEIERQLIVMNQHLKHLADSKKTQT